MDSKEIHAAMKNRLPVVYEGVRYDRILEYTSWYDDKGVHRLSVVLHGRNCTMRVPADRVKMED